MRNLKFYILKTWDSRSGKIGRKFIFKNSFVLGSDAKADVCLAGLKGFEARLDTESLELSWIESDSKTTVEWEKIFQVGPYALQIFEMDLVNNPRLRKAMPFLGGFAVFIFGILLFTVFAGKGECNFTETMIAAGEWKGPGRKHLREDIQEVIDRLIETDRSFNVSLKEGNFVKARAELGEIKKLLEETGVRAHCGALKPYYKRESDLSRSVVNLFLKEENYLRAAEELSRLKSRVPSGSFFKTLEGKVLAGARDLYLEGYRLDEEDPEKAFEYMESAQGVCRALGYSEDCYRNNKSRPKVAKASSKSRDESDSEEL